ncbi:MAG: hypothetical protein HYW71_00870 [Candidatus Niyogibacteria bacterium]|nr:hypothetical protein [Candidatus Niyogibacteria bacterium]
MEKHKKNLMIASFGIGLFFGLISFELFKEKDKKDKFKTETEKIFKEADNIERKIKEKILKKRIENFIE